MDTRKLVNGYLVKICKRPFSITILVPGYLLKFKEKNWCHTQAMNPVPYLWPPEYKTIYLKGCPKSMPARFIQIKRLRFTKITLKYFSIGERKYQIYKQGDGIMTESKYCGIHDILDSGTSQKNLMNFIFTIRWVYSQNILKFLKKHFKIYLCFLPYPIPSARIL